ncbi:MAG: aspartate/glutamate racemase family protein [Sulfurospirillaceae bacterium]|nr:aspartate/glutamate racemase family protein [Sulfurospirillaceae bacterium]
MKTIGLIGGMSWESTLSYYKLLNEGVKARLGGLHSAKIILFSVDFAPIAQFQNEGKWEEAGEILAQAAQSLEKAGAEIILLCTNTMHKVAPQIVKNCTVPFLHIAEATASALLKNHSTHTLLLGTKFTMQERFYKDILAKHGITTYVPNQNDTDCINRIIFNELCLGIINDEAKQILLKIINTIKMNTPVIDSVILGCTEIGLLLVQNDLQLTVFDTTILHVNEALHRAISEN